MLPKISTRARLAFGLSMIVVSLMMAALAIGLIPDHHGTVNQARCSLSESLAIQTRPLLMDRELQQMDRLLLEITKRNDDVLSGGLRRGDGELVVYVDGHKDLWNPEQLDDEALAADERFVFVPLFTDNDQQWGRLELCFEPLRRAGLYGILDNPQYQFIAFMGGLCLIAFNAYLWLMLRQVDAKNVAPENVRNAYSTMADGVLLVNKDDRIILANDSFASAIGVASEKLIGKRLSELPWFNVDLGADKSPNRPSIAIDELPWSRAIAGEEINQSVVIGYQTPGDVHPIFTVGCSVVRDDAQQLKGMLISLSNVTELEETKRELNVAMQSAEAANEAKSTFLANMSHEIRTPMNAVLGFTDILRRGIEGDIAKQQKYLNTIHASGSHLLSLINDILDLSKVEAGRLEVESIECQPHLIVRDVLQVLDAPAKKKNLKLDFKCDDPIPESILSDPARIRQVLLNLVGNAIKFTSEGGVTVGVAIDETGPTPIYEFRVTDTGIGLSPEAIDRIFDPFSQADASTTRNFGGTGLGLSISKRFSEALGDGIRVESVVGEGSTFIVRISAPPVADAVRIQPSMEDLETHLSVEDARVMRLPTMRILLVDDGEENRDLLSIILEEAGVDYVAAENGLVAYETAMNQDFDCVLMDMQMPVMDGYTATSKLRTDGFKNPIVALTAHAMQGDADKCYDAGCSHFLTKPIDIDHLLGMLSEIAHSLGLTERKPDDATSQNIDTAVFAAPAIAMTSPRVVEDGAPIESTLPVRHPKFNKIVRKFTSRLESSIEAIETACRDEDSEALRSLSHALKGTSANCGFLPISNVAAEVEDLAKEGEVVAALAEIRRLQALAKQVVTPEPLACTGDTAPSDQNPIAVGTRRAFSDDEMMALDLSLETQTPDAPPARQDTPTA